MSLLYRCTKKGNKEQIQVTRGSLEHTRLQESKDWEEVSDKEVTNDITDSSAIKS